jgi:hypothetical protein
MELASILLINRTIITQMMQNTFGTHTTPCIHQNIEQENFAMQCID